MTLCVSCSVMSDSATPWTIAHQASLSMEFSRQEYWSGMPFPSPEELPNPVIEPWSLALQAGSLPFELQGSPNNDIIHHYNTIQSITALFLCSLVIYLSPPHNPPPPQSLIFSLSLQSFVFSRMSCTWNHTVCSLSDWLLSLSNMHLRFPYVFLWLDSSFLFIAE